ncbi:MAG: hypothetical protein AW07_03853 [Candidatus Accumulibacter sp. SK-11]|nr:MAG: hypothetical protein AW07_03853 [Candidatus Accumulibacter sp. SK-11]
MELLVLPRQLGRRRRQRNRRAPQQRGGLGQLVEQAGVALEPRQQQGLPGAGHRHVVEAPLGVRVACLPAN